MRSVSSKADGRGRFRNMKSVMPTRSRNAAPATPKPCGDARHAPGSPKFGQSKTPLSVGVDTADLLKVFRAPERHCAVGAQVVQVDSGRLAPTMAVCVVIGRPHLLGDCCNKGVDIAGTPHRNARPSFDRLGVLARLNACVPASAGDRKTAQDLGEADQGFRMCHGWPFIQS